MCWSHTLIAFAVSSDCSGGMPTSRSRSSCWMKNVISLPAIGICLMQLPITYPSAYKQQDRLVTDSTYLTQLKALLILRRKMCFVDVAWLFVCVFWRQCALMHCRNVMCLIFKLWVARLPSTKVGEMHVPNVTKNYNNIWRGSCD